MGLLKQFEGMQLPAASELEWLVPEHDAPQKVGLWVPGHRLHLIFPEHLASAHCRGALLVPVIPLWSWRRGFVRAPETDAAERGSATAASYSRVPGSLGTPLLQPPFSWSSSSVSGSFPEGCSCRCIAFAVPGRDLTLLPASPSSCPSPTLCPSLLMMENMPTSTS